MAVTQVSIAICNQLQYNWPYSFRVADIQGGFVRGIPEAQPPPPTVHGEREHLKKGVFSQNFEHVYTPPLTSSRYPCFQSETSAYWIAL